MNRSARWGAAAAVAVLVLGACGGGSKSESSAQSTTSATAAQSTTSTTAQSGSVGPGLLSERCRNYTGYAAAVGLAMAAAVNPEAAAQLQRLKDSADLAAAPEEIRDDFAVIIDYAKEFGDVLAEYPSQSGALNPAAMAALTELADEVDEDRITEASNNIEAWVAANCR